MKRHHLILIALAIVGAAIWWIKAQSAGPTTTVVAGKIHRQTVARALVVSRDPVVRVHAMVAGKLSKVAVRRGDVVKKNQLLATIDKTDLLHAQKQAAINAGDGDVQSDHDLLAPVAGTVTAVKAATGTSVFPQVLLFEIENLANLQVRIEIDERDLGNVSRGQAVRLRRPGNSDVIAEGTIERIAQRLETRRIGLANLRARATGNVGVAWMKLPAKNALMLGSQLEATLALGATQVEAMLPHAAVRIKDGKSYVLTPGGLFPERRDVVLKISDAKHVPVTGLAVGTVVLDGVLDGVLAGGN